MKRQRRTTAPSAGAEQALRDSESRYRLLFEANPCPMCIFDENTLNMVDVNAAALHLYGHSREAFLEMTIKDIRPPEEGPSVVAAIGAQRRLLRPGPAKGRRVGGRGRGSAAPLAAGEWRHLKRDGTVFDACVTLSAVQYAGREAWLCVVDDVTARKHAERELQRRLALEQLLAMASSRLVNASNATLEAVIKGVLADVGCLMGADRCYLFHVADDLAMVENTHEWCAPGIRSQLADLRKLPTAAFEWMFEQMRDGDPLSISRVSELGTEAAAERQLMESGHVQSAMLVPIRHGGTLTGLIGCDAVRSEHHWSDADIRLLRIVGETIADAQVRCRNDEAVRNAALELERRVEERTAALRENAEKLRTTLAAAHAIAWELELAGGTLTETGDVATLLDQAAGFRHRTSAAFLESVHPEDRAAVSAQIERAIQNPATDHKVEFRFLHPDGSIHWLASIGSVECDAAGRPLRLRGITHEITAQKQAESVLARTHRALRVLTECGHALLRESNEQDLLRDACRIVTEVGGYRMAWVGYAVGDAQKSVQPMELVGLAKNYLSRVSVTWADDKLGRGPTGAAIRTGEVCLCRDASRDPAFAPWRKEALKRGCASVLALPLLAEHGCLGALTIYAEQSDAFDEPEILLLQQLASDLSFGIMAIRGRLERAKLERQVLDISEREQRRIGQDLHDGVGQSIIGIGYLISAVQQSLINRSAPEAAELERIIVLISKTVHEVRDMAGGLFPEELRQGRITDALQDLARQTQNVYGMACRFSGKSTVKLADANRASQVYRIAQEAVNNAAKHSRAKAIGISLQQRRRNIILTVRDTGTGIPKAAGKPTGMGQRIMKYRADMIGATLKIDSNPGKGTTVTCVIAPWPAATSETTP